MVLGGNGVSSELEQASIALEAAENGLRDAVRHNADAGELDRVVAVLETAQDRFNALVWEMGG